MNLTYRIFPIVKRESSDVKLAFIRKLCFTDEHDIYVFVIKKIKFEFVLAYTVWIPLA